MRSKSIVCLIFTLSFFSLLYVFFELLFITKSSKIERINLAKHFDTRNHSNPTICDIPFDMNPFDPMISNFIKKVNRTILCGQLDNKSFNSLYNLHQGRSLSYMNDYDPIVRIVPIHGYGKALKCMYEPFNRVDGDDDNVDFLEKKPIIGYKLDLEKIGTEFVNIECYFLERLVYSNIHSWPSRVSSHYNATASGYSYRATLKNRSNTDRESVMFLVIESMSSLNFKRFMVETEKALSKFSNSFTLKGLNKIADNSFPNMMPILSGFRPYYGDWPFKFDVDSGPYDNVPFIWDDFKRKNYTTGYIEDYPKYGLFNYLAAGFEKAPTDWYPRPYWLKMDYDQRDQDETFCYKQRPKIVYWLKQIKQFLNKVNATKQPFFLWSFYIQVTHDDFNNAQLVDQYIADFINSYQQILENTVFVIMGDHGNRYGPLAMTGYGQIETRMPFFNMHLPIHLLKKHKHLEQYLKINEKRLTTWLDIREILKDIVSDNYASIVQRSKRSAYSVWREEVPAERTCSDALIPMEFCLCLKKSSVSVNTQLAQITSSAVIIQLNRALSSYNHICHMLSLNTTLKLQIIQLSGERWPSNHVEVTISTNPSNGVFQAHLYLKNSENLKNSSTYDWALEGDISRLNAYGNQSFCINDRVLRKFCYCRELTKS